jgi:hypothetical protein
MALGTGNTRGSNQRGTPNPTNDERVHIRYTAGADVWATPTVARIAIERGQAKPIAEPKNKNRK